MLLDNIPYHPKDSDCGRALDGIMKARFDIPVPGNFGFMPNAFDPYQITPQQFHIINHVSEIMGYIVVSVEMFSVKGPYTVCGLVETSAFVPNQPVQPLSVLTHKYNNDYASGRFHGGHPV